MRTPQRRMATVSLLVSVALVAASCGSDDGNDSTSGVTAVADDGADGTTDEDSETAADSGAEGRSVVIAIADEPSTLDPQIAEDGNERAVTDNIYETLLRRDTETNDLIPHLARELPTQIDDTTWEFTLREDVRFTNGEAFNAEAVVYSVERVLDPDFGSAQLSFYGPINGAEAVDEFTVRITTDGFDPAVPARMYRLKMMPPGADGTDFGQEAIGTGPYQLERWDRGRQVLLSSNEDYWGLLPQISEVTFRFIPSSSTRVAGLGTGEINLATAVPPEQVADAPQVLTREGIEFPVYRLKNYEGPLEDPRVRQAMNYAVDKNSIAEDLYGGFATVASCQALTPGHFGYHPSLEPYPYDPDRARELLDEAGYNGEPLDFLGATGRWLKDSEIHEVIIGYLSEVGFNFDVDIRPFSAYLERFVPSEGQIQPDLGFVSSSNELFDASLADSYYLSTGSLSSFRNDDVDDALNAARVEANTDQRESYFHEALQIGCQENPVFLFLVNPQDIYGASADLNWVPRLDSSIYVPEMSLQ